MSLTEYRRKRQFARTAEPEPGKPIAAGQRAIFVVQLHHASHRHYDFRLQVGDVLRSWAVPKGPSLDPKVKRLAVQVEDHPIDYAEFEGIIPEGEYGGGHVALFDRGVWSTQSDAQTQLTKGHLRFELFGQRLRGAWHLVRGHRSARQQEWLLLKENDAFAASMQADDMLEDIAKAPQATHMSRSVAAKKSSAVKAPRRSRRIDWSGKAAALPAARRAALKSGAFPVQLARLVGGAPTGTQWLHEIKWDGYRLLAVIVERTARLWSRNAIEWTAKLPEIVAGLEQLGIDRGVFDGELIAGEGRRADFGLLQSTLSGERQASLTYVIFDMLHLDGIAIDRAPLIERKILLEQLLKTQPSHIAFSAHIPGDGAAAVQLSLAHSFEGIISKRADLAYRPGRSDDWQKTKSLDSDEFAVVGYTAPKGTRSGFGSLLLARPDADCGWSYAGRVGSGFSDESVAQIARCIGRSGGPRPTVHLTVDDPELRRAHWFKPKFVVEVFSRGLGNQGLLRQPTLKALRLDREIGDLEKSVRRAKPTPAARKGAKRVATPLAHVRLTHPRRIVFSEGNVTKQDVANYYLAVMHLLLPEIANRPLSIVRCPEGAGAECFYQKHRSTGLQRVDSVRLSGESGNLADYLVVKDADDLMELVQFNALEFHPWGALADRPERADRIVFDLDPAPDVAWSEVKRAATQIRALLEQLSLVSFLRTTGGKGLHVVVPLNPGCDWVMVKRFAHGFATTLAGHDPARYVAVATKARRRGRIFIDYLRNSLGATSVASYSLRARAGAPVAFPIAWSELARLKQADAFNIKTLPRKLARRKQDPWADINQIRQDLSRWSDG